MSTIAKASYHTSNVVCCQEFPYPNSSLTARLTNDRPMETYIIFTEYQQKFKDIFPLKHFRNPNEMERIEETIQSLGSFSSIVYMLIDIVYYLQSINRSTKKYLSNDINTKAILQYLLISFVKTV